MFTLFIQNTPLYYATRQELVEVVILLMKNGADPNLKNSKKVTGLLKSLKFAVDSFIIIGLRESLLIVADTLLKVYWLL